MTRRSSWQACGGGAGVGALGGLIGLGGAEFRLPLLIGWFGLGARVAVPINLLISLSTVVAALLARLLVLGGSAVPAHAGEILTLGVGSMAAAWIAAGWLARMPGHLLERLIAGVLFAMAGVLFAEGALPPTPGWELADLPVLRLAAGLGCGMVIGIVSSLLGVAGGELIIPVLVLLFAVDVKTAGTASLMISLPTVALGLLRHWRRGAFDERAPLRSIAAPMALGSIVGANLGAALAGLAPTPALKLTLGAVLAISAVGLYRRARRPLSSRQRRWGRTAAGR
jgi:uncharacterized membrane protein YfcA